MLTAEVEDQPLLCGHSLHRLSKTQPGVGLLPHRRERLQTTITLPPASTTSDSLPRRAAEPPRSVRTDRKRGDSRKQQEMAAGAGQRLLLSVH